MSESTDGLWPALLQVQGELGTIAHDAQADSGTRHRYASLAAVLDVVRPALWRAGVVLTQDTTARPELGLVEVHTHLVHASSGERVSATVSVAPTTPTRKDGSPVLTEPQQVGVAISYARRYGVLCALGLATDDADGVAPSASREPPAPAPASPDDVLAPRKAALRALAARIGSQDEVGRRLDIVAGAPDDPRLDHGAPARERLGAAMGGHSSGWRRLTDPDFAELITVLGDWPGDL